MQLCSAMLAGLLQWDETFFLWINKGWSNATLDVVMPWLRTQESWYPLYGLILLYLSFKFRLKAFGIVFIMAAMIFTGDSLLSGTAKRTFKRPRPCHVPALESKMVKRVNCGGAFGYFSAHATNHFAMAMFFTVLFHRRFRYLGFIALPWAAAIALAQVYVGVHYPLDVITGTFAGCLIGWAYALLARKTLKI